VHPFVLQTSGFQVGGSARCVSSLRLFFFGALMVFGERREGEAKVLTPAHEHEGARHPGKVFPLGDLPVG
jgi:hypothetical protein